MKFTRILILLALAGWLPHLAPAQVEASLVGADKTIMPGEPFTVALRLQHDAHWHTYWLNPGTGLATNITWQLPPGFTAGPIQWPAPVILKDRVGNVIGNGYEGDQLIPVTITPPSELPPGTTVVLKANVDWLMCEDVCMPGDANLELSLPVANEIPAANGKLGDRIDEVVSGGPR
jgi:DsbC/DsbD-like thiol-disulfide interchange protein